MSPLAPVMFVSHGSPMFAVEPGTAGRQLRERSSLFDEVRAILVVSPHWQTRGSFLTGSGHPETIHDFGGFPEELYQLHYPATGAPELIPELMSVLKHSGIEVNVDDRRGLDHGAWVPLMHLRPDADIPVIQLSLNVDHDPQTLVCLGRALASLRAQGIALVASGGVTHNLYDMRLNIANAASYAERFQTWVRKQVVDRDVEALKYPDISAPDYARAHPSPEHYRPLLIAMGATDEQDHLEILPSEVLYHVISMESYLWI